MEFEKIGTHKKKYKNWNKKLKGLYKQTFDTTICGSEGSIWLVTEGKQKYLTISTTLQLFPYSTIFRHHILNKKGLTFFSDTITEKIISEI